MLKLVDKLNYLLNPDVIKERCGIQSHPNYWESDMVSVKC